MTQEYSMQLASMNPVLAQMAGSDSTGTATTQSGTTGAVTGQQSSQSQGFGSMIFVVPLIVGMFLVMSMSGRKEKKKRASMLSTLGKRDKVRTAGGIIGTVIEIKDNEVLIETDKSSHTRLWLAKGSVSTVLDSASKPSEMSSSDSETDSETVSA